MLFLLHLVIWQCHTAILPIWCAASPTALHQGRRGDSVCWSPSPRGAAPQYLPARSPRPAPWHLAELNKPLRWSTIFNLKFCRLTDFFCTNPPAALRLLVPRVRLSEDFLSPMMMTTPGTIGLLPAAGVRRYCAANVIASPAEGDIETNKTPKRSWLKMFKDREKSPRFDLCYFLGFHQMVLTESLVEVYQTCRGDSAGTIFWVCSHKLQLPP